MRFSNRLAVLALFCSYTYAQPAIDTSVLTDSDKAMLLDSQQVMLNAKNDTELRREISGNQGALTESDLDMVQDSYEIMEGAKFRQELVEIRQQADEINAAIRQRQSLTVPAAEQSINTQELAQFLLETLPQSEEIVPRKAAAEKTAEPPQVLWLFVSSSMPEMEMKKTLQMASEWGARVVFRGMRPEDTSLNDMVKYVVTQKQLLAKHQSDVIRQAQSQEEVKDVYNAGIFIDPMAFDRFKVDRVPTMVYERTLPDGRQFFGRVTGLISASYLQEKTEEAMVKSSGSDFIDLGEMGLVFGIAERDLIVEMKSRMAAIDWQKMQQVAVERHWQRRKFVTLPPSQIDQRLEMDPTVEVKEDVVATNGTVLARRGDTFNPLMYLPTALTILVFDATDENEVAFVRHQVLNQKPGRLKLIATQIDRERGFEHFKQLQRDLKMPVTLLTDDIKLHFNLQATPVRVFTSPRAVYEIDYYSQQTIKHFNNQQKEQKSWHRPPRFKPNKLGKIGGSCFIAYRLRFGRTQSLTYAPQANTACPAALIFSAALVSLSSIDLHSGQIQWRIFNGKESTT